MSVREGRKKIQRSIEYIAAAYPAKIAVPELQKIQQTASAVLQRLATPSLEPAAVAMAATEVPS